MTLTAEALRLLREIEDRRQKPGGGEGREEFEARKRDLLERLAERLASRLPEHMRGPQA